MEEDRKRHLDSGGDVESGEEEWRFVAEASPVVTSATNRKLKPDLIAGSATEEQSFPVAFINTSFLAGWVIARPIGNTVVTMTGNVVRGRQLEDGAKRSSRVIRDCLIPFEEINRLSEVGNYELKD